MTEKELTKVAYRLIALDLDGTLIGRNRQISETNRKWIARAREAGIHVTLATGRPFAEAAGYAAQLELEAPLVVNNGSEIRSLPDVLHIREELDPGSVQELFRLLDRYGNEASFWAHTVQGTIGPDNRRQLPGPIQWLQFAVSSKNPAVLEEIVREVKSWNAFEISNSHPANMECNPRGVTKASGLAEVCRLLGIGMSEVIAAGDSLNDIPMIRAAGLGIAMGNAQEPVKMAADAVAPSHLEDGVAEIIRKYIFG